MSHIATRLRTLQEMKPENLIEAMLSNQMLAVNNFALNCLKPNVRAEGAGYFEESILDRATKLMKLCLDQVEAMQKLKGHSSQQRVTVEHVQVHEGGQAIVGVVAGSAPGGGRGKEHDEQ